MIAASLPCFYALLRDSVIEASLFVVRPDFLAESDNDTIPEEDAGTLLR